MPLPGPLQRFLLKYMLPGSVPADFRQVRGATPELLPAVQAAEVVNSASAIAEFGTRRVKLFGQLFREWPQIILGERPVAEAHERGRISRAFAQPDHKAGDL